MSYSSSHQRHQNGGHVSALLNLGSLIGRGVSSRTHELLQLTHQRHQNGGHVSALLNLGSLTGRGVSSRTHELLRFTHTSATRMEGMCQPCLTSATSLAEVKQG